MGILLVIVIALVVLGAYWVDVRINPWHPCPRCSGSKSHKSRLRPGAYGRCHKCKGSGQAIKLGVRVLAPGLYREMKAGHSGRNF